MSLYNLRLCLFSAALFLLFSHSGSAADFAKDITPFLQKNCLECHNAKVQKGELSLEGIQPKFQAKEELENWKLILQRTSHGEMPPANKPRPHPRELETFIQWLESQLGGVEKARQAKEGRTILRRLNQKEYENTLRDLLGVPVRVAELLPEDTRAHGFDTIGEALTISPVHMERYLAAARKALDLAITKAPQPKTETTRHDMFERGYMMTRIGKAFLKRADGSTVVFARENNVMHIAELFSARNAGKYRIRLEGQGYQSERPIAFSLHIARPGAGAEFNLLTYDEVPPQQYKTFEYTLWLEKGASLRFWGEGLKLPGYNSNPDRHGPVESYKGEGIAIRNITIEGPFYDVYPHKATQMLFGDTMQLKKNANPKQFMPYDFISKNPKEDAKRFLQPFASAAFRRPVDAQKLEPYIQLFESILNNGSTFEEAIKSAASAILCSPDFLFLVEPVGPLDDYAIASRLSYFLTRSCPDAELLELAARKKLRQPEVLHQQTERLLKSPLSERFVNDFLDSWLDLRNITATMPDKLLYPEVDPQLQHAALQESREFFQHLVRGNRPAVEIVDADYALLNERLAQHYGIPGVLGVAFRKVPLKPEYHRGGVLAQAAVLKVSANGSNTSPVVRGVYVLERIMGQVPPTPPPGVPAVEPDIRGAKTVRELLAKHRESENCAGCHRSIDPPGFALESFDVMGGYREKFRVLVQKPGPRKWDNGLPVDSSGEWLDGRKFANFAEFQKQLASDPKRIARTLTKKLISFSTGHEPGLADADEIQKILQGTEKSQYAVRDLIHAIVQSPVFLTK